MKDKHKQLNDHEIALLVNDLTATAREYGQYGCCREKIREVVLKHLEFLPKPKQYKK